jgi:hypothetical protein
VCQRGGGGGKGGEEEREKIVSALELEFRTVIVSGACLLAAPAFPRTSTSNGPQDAEGRPRPPSSALTTPLDYE